MIWIQEIVFLFLLLFKMVILYFWHYLAFCFQLGWQGLHHYFIHLLLPQKLCIDEFVNEVAITLFFIKTVAWLSLNPQIKYPKIKNSDFFWPFHHSKTSSSFSFAAYFEQKQENENKKNKGCQEIIGLILFGKKPR